MRGLLENEDISFLACIFTGKHSHDVLPTLLHIYATFMSRNMRIIIMEALLAEQATSGKLTKLGRPDDINL